MYWSKSTSKSKWYTINCFDTSLRE